jgi:hypothetical protein
LSLAPRALANHTAAHLLRTASTMPRCASGHRLRLPAVTRETCDAAERTGGTRCSSGTGPADGRRGRRRRHGGIPAGVGDVCAAVARLQPQTGTALRRPRARPRVDITLMANWPAG